MARPRVLAVAAADLKPLEAMRCAASAPSRKVPSAESKVPSACAGGTKPHEFCPPGFQQNTAKQGQSENTRGQNQRSKVP
jgi:hypothetical protein